MQDEAIGGALAVTLPHTIRGKFRAEPNMDFRFGRVGPIPENFVSVLMDRGVEYDPELAYVLSIVSGWSYADGPTLAQQLKYYGLPGASVEQMAVLNPTMYIVATGYFVRSACGRVGILSFRGTDPINVVSWFVGSDMALRNFGGTGSVHRGFYANLRSLWEYIEPALQKATASGRQDGNSGEGHGPLQHLFLTGHSLGGALAVLAAAKILRDAGPEVRNAVRGVYTFGQPAVGDQAFATHYDKLFGDRLYRHEYGYDVVPSFPPLSAGGFVHFGEARVSSTSREGWRKASTMRRQAKLLTAVGFRALGSFVSGHVRAISWLDALVFKYSFFDHHSPARYIETSRAVVAAD